MNPTTETLPALPILTRHYPFCFRAGVGYPTVMMDENLDWHMIENPGSPMKKCSDVEAMLVIRTCASFLVQQSKTYEPKPTPTPHLPV